MKQQVGVLGGGSWGTTFASIVSRNAKVSIWARQAATVAEINQQHSNEKYLPDANLHPSLQAYNSIEETVKSADAVVMAVPSNSFRQVLEDAKPFIAPSTPVISLTKGLEHGTDLRMSEVILDVLPNNPVGVLTGPNLAREIMAGQAAASVIAMQDEAIMQNLQSIFTSGMFRVYSNTDVIGCELGGVLKNIIAIAVGMGVGLGAGDNTRAALITRGLSEITRLGVAMGGRAETFSGLTGMGDMIATCVSPQSRNHTVGVQLGEGKSIEQIIEEMYMVAEGVKSAPTVMQLAKKYNVEMPISHDVCEVVSGRKTAKQSFIGLLRTQVGSESDPG